MATYLLCKNGHAKVVRRETSFTCPSVAFAVWWLYVHFPPYFCWAVLQCLQLFQQCKVTVWFSTEQLFTKTLETGRIILIKIVGLKFNTTVVLRGIWRESKGILHANNACMFAFMSFTYVFKKTRTPEYSH